MSVLARKFSQEDRPVRQQRPLEYRLAALLDRPEPVRRKRPKFKKRPKSLAPERRAEQTAEQLAQVAQAQKDSDVQTLLETLDQLPLAVHPAPGEPSEEETGTNNRTLYLLPGELPPFPYPAPR